MSETPTDQTKDAVINSQGPVTEALSGLWCIKYLSPREEKDCLSVGDRGTLTT